MRAWPLTAGSHYAGDHEQQTNAPASNDAIGAVSTPVAGPVGDRQGDIVDDMDETWCVALGRGIEIAISTAVAITMKGAQAMNWRAYLSSRVMVLSRATTLGSPYFARPQRRRLTHDYELFVIVDMALCIPFTQVQFFRILSRK